MRGAGGGHVWAFTPWKGKTEDRPFARFGARPDTPAVLLDDALHDRQSNPLAFELLFAVQALKNPKQFPGLLRVKPHPIIPNRDHLFSIILRRADLNLGHLTVARVFDSVSDQVVYHLADANWVGA